MTVKAYQTAQFATEDPRATEYRLFGLVTGALLEARNKNTKGGPLAETLAWNRKVWQALANDCMDERNRLPQAVRAQIISLSLWITKYSKKVMREGAPVDPLIEVNRTIMQGLQDAA